MNSNGPRGTAQGARLGFRSPRPCWQRCRSGPRGPSPRGEGSAFGPVPGEGRKETGEDLESGVERVAANAKTRAQRRRVEATDPGTLRRPCFENADRLFCSGRSRLRRTRVSQGRRHTLESRAPSRWSRRNDGPRLSRPTWTQEEIQRDDPKTGSNEASMASENDRVGAPRWAMTLVGNPFGSRRRSLKSQRPEAR
ncbi:hypothetical protein M885DRAFT_33249 [Pelagophyceae sp. CCMP2097]|nr:hypothetical protein M885DRAFT_33249 [Pelagophyceae sp. CCMP2097]